jgi:hypothetical protein
VNRVKFTFYSFTTVRNLLSRLPNFGTIERMT